MIKFFIRLFDNSAERMLNGGFKLNHFHQAEYRNITRGD